MSVFRDNIKGFHLELTNICTLKCPACPRTLNKFSKHWKNHNIKLDHLKKFLDLDISGLDFMLCGNYGDPIYHPDIIEICRWLKSRGARIMLVTNGSYQKPAFWRSLSEIMTAEDEVVWSIDGTPENFTDYRINGDWDSIKQGIDIMVGSPAKMTWKYIVFKFNEDSIEQAKQLSKQLGIDEFSIQRSDRWADIPDMKPSSAWLGDRIEEQDQYVKGNRNIKVDPQCSSGKMHFISAEGFYSPCCFISLHHFYYKSLWGSRSSRDQFNIADHTFTQIMQNAISIKFEHDIENDPPDVCKFQCPRKIFNDKLLNTQYNREDVESP